MGNTRLIEYYGGYGDAAPDFDQPKQQETTMDIEPEQFGRSIREIAFQKELASVINKYSFDTRLNIPDFLIAEHLFLAMVQLGETTRKAAEWGSNFLAVHEKLSTELAAPTEVNLPVAGDVLFKRYDSPSSFDEIFPKPSQTQMPYASERTSSPDLFD